MTLRNERLARRRPLRWLHSLVIWRKSHVGPNEGAVSRVWTERKLGVFGFATITILRIMKNRQTRRHDTNCTLRQLLSRLSYDLWHSTWPSADLRARFCTSLCRQKHNGKYYHIISLHRFKINKRIDYKLSTTHNHSTPLPA